jgi:hypothetical protein
MTARLPQSLRMGRPFILLAGFAATEWTQLMFLSAREAGGEARRGGS